ncbi:MAG: rRNA maturation RNase YbeY [Candidatus Pacebacteria bacterium]|nr:rRNA maturation RNase YbeY [Candidatus Paceibacterota bacterium]
MILQIKNFTKQKINKKYLDRIAEETLKVVKIKKPVEISLVIAGEKRIKSLNKKHRGIDRVTDVLSFGNENSGDDIKFVIPPNDILQFGEIFICYPKIEKQAKEKKHSVKKEFSILLIHGILHLAGYDHKGSYENSEMKDIELKVLDNFKF